MAYFPLFDVLDVKGFTTLANFSPNDWETVATGRKDIWAIQTNGKSWVSKKMEELEENTFKTFTMSDFPATANSVNAQEGISELVLLKMGSEPLGASSDILPPDHSLATEWPEWRATVGFKRNSAQVSYQGEINPFPEKASLLTFHPFIQYEETENYFIFLNIEKSPVHRWADMGIYNSFTREKIFSAKVRNNCANIIPLDKYNFSPRDLPVFNCNNMAGIPFGFGMSISSDNLSLEHTHPPGSLTIHGNRMNAQKYIKSQWAKFLNA